MDRTIDSITKTPFLLGTLQPKVFTAKGVSGDALTSQCSLKFGKMKHPIANFLKQCLILVLTYAILRQKLAW